MAPWTVRHPPRSIPRGPSASFRPPTWQAPPAAARWAAEPRPDRRATAGRTTAARCRRLSGVWQPIRSRPRREGRPGCRPGRGPGRGTPRRPHGRAVAGRSWHREAAGSGVEGGRRRSRRGGRFRLRRRRAQERHPARASWPVVWCPVWQRWRSPRGRAEDWPARPDRTPTPDRCRADARAPRPVRPRPPRPVPGRAAVAGPAGRSSPPRPWSTATPGARRVRRSRC